VHGFFLSDPDFTEHHLEVLWGVRNLLPPIGILHWSWSQWRGDYPPAHLDWATLSPNDFDTTLRAAMLHRFGVSLRLPELRPELFERLRLHVDLFQRELVPFVRDGVLQPLTPTPERGGFGERAPSIQLSHPDGRSVIGAFVLDGGQRPPAVFPRGLEPDVIYLVTDLADGDVLRASGAELAAEGLVLHGDDAVTSWLLLVEPLS
jgi:alpha-galactosidase